MIQDPAILTRVAKWLGLKGTSPEVMQIPFLGAVLTLPIEKDSPSKGLPSLPLTTTRLTVQQFTAPAVGVDFIVTVPQDEIWRVHSMQCRLVTSGVGGPRYLEAVAYLAALATEKVWGSPIPGSVGISSTVNITFAIGMPPVAAAAPATATGFLPGWATLMPGMHFGLWVYQLNAADQIDQCIIAYEKFSAW